MFLWSVYIRLWTQNGHYILIHFMPLVFFYTSWKTSENQRYSDVFRGCIVRPRDMKWINPFVPNAPFLYPLKTSENRKVFWCFQGVEKGCIGKIWVKVCVFLWPAKIPHSWGSYVMSIMIDFAGRSELYLRPYQISMTELFCENS